MAKLITRTFITTKVKYSFIEADEAGSPHAKVADVVLTGDFTKETATKALTKELGFTPVVLNVETVEEIRGMDVKAFYENSVTVERPASQKKTEA
jgi:hypothetical protein|nr:MAG TPA_asm: Histone-like Protein p6 [Caudoviricetes sp.]